MLNFNDLANTIYNDVTGNPSIGDGQEVAGEALLWTVGSPPAAYTSWMINGNPIVSLNGWPSVFYLVTNNLANISPGTATQGTYFYCFLTGTQIHTPTGSRNITDR